MVEIVIIYGLAQYTPYVTEPHGNMLIVQDSTIQ